MSRAGCLLENMKSAQPKISIFRAKLRSFCVSAVKRQLCNAITRLEGNYSIKTAIVGFLGLHLVVISSS